MRHDSIAHDDQAQTLTELTGNASGLGRELVEVSSFLGQLDAQCRGPMTSLGDVTTQAHHLGAATSQMLEAVDRMRAGSDAALADVRKSTAFIGEGGQASQGIAAWVNGVHGDGETVREMLQAIQLSNSTISDIASQVTILAVNAKIEAARAGQAGKGFSIVADSVNELSLKTSEAADEVSETVVRLSDWLGGLQKGAAQNAKAAVNILDRAAQTDQALASIETQVASLGEEAHGLSADTQQAKDVVDRLEPLVNAMGAFVHRVAEGVEQTTRRCEGMVDTSEDILQQSVSLGGDGADTPMIARVQDLAGRNEKPFLLQVYNRDMGGGNFVMMKDLSAPIRVHGRHWGGLRLAYKF